MSKIDYLTEDNINPIDQVFTCVSFFSKHYVKQSIENLNDYVDETGKGTKEDYSTEDDVLGFKIRGSYRTFEEAANHAKDLRSIDPNFHVYIIENNKWGAFKIKDDGKYVEQTEHANEELNDMMKKYDENQTKAQLYHEFRKNLMIKKSLEENLENRITSINETENELVNITDKNERRKLKDKKNVLEEQILKLEEKKKEIEEQSRELELKLKLGQPNFDK